MKILIVCGGDSREREVSIKTGRAVKEALTKSFSDVECFICSSKKECLSAIIKKNPDIVFIALHGGWGENGELQAALDFFGIKYTGSGYRASVLAMDKFASKSIFKAAHLPAAEGILIHTPKEAEAVDFFPVCIKPNTEGSSIGVEFAKNREELKEKTDKLLEEFPEILVESQLFGRELTVGILDETIFPIIEIKPLSGFYDYKSKYTKGQTEYIVPAELPKNIELLCKKVAFKAYKILGCKSCARVDIILHNNIPYLLEVNTVPGMTETSLIPKAARAYGMSFDELTRLMIEREAKG